MSPDRRRYMRGNPDTLLSLGVCASIGAIIVILGSPPPSLVNATSFPIGMAWAVVFTVAAIVALAGVLWTDELVGWVLELSGRVALVFAAAAYALVLSAAIASPGALLVLGLVSGVAVASGWRVRQITRRLDEWRATLDGTAA